MRYFFAENSNRLICGVRFEVLDNFGGTIRGVYATDDEALAKRLAEATTGVGEISAEEYESRRKKKAHTIGSFPNSNPQSPQQGQAALKAKAVVVAESGATQTPENSDKPKTKDEAVTVGTVE